ncbi:MAG TPA: excalibur calcium-binding domain-containing protein [Propionicimonas sp.]|jgi:hypothetical protein|nr:excalibur calcium-binding domain-containing protein [Propionicimonas sp.]
MKSTRATLAAAALAAVLAFAPGVAAAQPAAAVPAAAPATSPQFAPRTSFKNCTAMNKVYPHGVGRKNAKDHTSGKRVTNFKHNTALYRKIMAHRDLDRDNDGIACERA